MRCRELKCTNILPGSCHSEYFSRTFMTSAPYFSSLSSVTPSICSRTSGLEESFSVQMGEKKEKVMKCCFFMSCSLWPHLDKSSPTKKRSLYFASLKKSAHNWKCCSMHARLIVGGVTLKWHTIGAAPSLFIVWLLKSQYEHSNCLNRLSSHLTFFGSTVECLIWDW